MKIIKTLAYSLLVLITFSCDDLKIQENFEFVQETVPPVTFEDQTAWQWLQTKKSPEGSDIYAPENADNFDILIDVIEAAGLKSIYDSANTSYTFFLLKNGAWRDETRAGIFRDNNRNSDILEAYSPELLTQDFDVQLFDIIIKYHTIDQYIDQGGDVLKLLNVDYTFDTLYENEEFGFVTINRNERFVLHINFANNLPRTRKRTNKLRHNYIFKNGIGHLAIEEIRLANFKNLLE